MGAVLFVCLFFQYLTFVYILAKKWQIIFGSSTPVLVFQAVDATMNRVRKSWSWFIFEISNFKLVNLFWTPPPPWGFNDMVDLSE